MIRNARAGPKTLDMGTCRGNASAGFPSHHDDAHAAAVEINSLFAGDFREVDGIAGRAAEHGRPQFDERSQPSDAAQAAARDAKAAEASRSVKGQPETEE